MDDKKEDAFAGPKCANCAATKNTAGQPVSQKCARCKLVAYCSRECQGQHWKSGSHKKWCLTPKERSLQQFALTEEEDIEASSDVSSELYDAPSCSVCQEPIESAKMDLVETLPCLHIFHISCMKGLRSYALQRACPLCRAELPFLSDTSVTNRCVNCGNERPNGVPLASCSKCKIALYCGRDCQLIDWESGSHKAICAQATRHRVAVSSSRHFFIFSRV